MQDYVGIIGIGIGIGTRTSNTLNLKQTKQ